MFPRPSTTIGLFQGMFERNILTFNPGWDADAKPVDTVTRFSDRYATWKIRQSWRSIRSGR